MGRLRRSLVAGVALVVFAGACGTEDGTGSDGGSPAPTGPSSPSSEPAQVDGVVPHVRNALLSQPGAGGQVSTAPVVLDGPAAVAEFVAQLDGGLLAGDVQAAIGGAAPGPDEVVVASVVAIGCDPPEEVVVRRTAGGIEVARVGKADLSVQCRLPITTVVVLTVPSASLR